MEYNFNKPLFSYEEEKEIEGTNMGKLLALQLSQATTGNPIKMMCWAIDLFKGNPIHLDEVDKKVLKDFIENHNLIFNLAKYQLIKILEP